MHTEPHNVNQDHAGPELAELAEEKDGADVKRWQPIDGLFCVGGPVCGCIFALVGGSFAAPGLVLVGLGDPGRCVALVNSDGFVSLRMTSEPANSLLSGTQGAP